MQILVGEVRFGGKSPSGGDTQNVVRTISTFYREISGNTER